MKFEEISTSYVLGHFAVKILKLLAGLSHGINILNIS